LYFVETVLCFLGWGVVELDQHFSEPMPTASISPTSTPGAISSFTITCARRADNSLFLSEMDGEKTYIWQMFCETVLPVNIARNRATKKIMGT